MKKLRKFIKELRSGNKNATIFPIFPVKVFQSLLFLEKSSLVILSYNSIQD